MLIRWTLYWLPMFQGQTQKSGPSLFWTGRSLSPAILASYPVFVRTYQFQFLHWVRLPSAPRPWLFPLTGCVSRGSQFGQTLGAFYCRRLVVTDLLHERMCVEDRFSQTPRSSSSALPVPVYLTLEWLPRLSKQLKYPKGFPGSSAVKESALSQEWSNPDRDTQIFYDFSNRWTLNTVTGELERACQWRTKKNKEMLVQGMVGR